MKPTYNPHLIADAVGNFCIILLLGLIGLAEAVYITWKEVTR
jgi:hypothetical protein